MRPLQHTSVCSEFFWAVHEPSLRIVHCAAADVVSSLLGYVGVADLALREELVLKTAILAEKYAHSMDW